MLERVRASARYAAGLGRYLRRTWRLDGARRSIEARLATREAAFLTLLERGVYGNPRSPYRTLLAHAGIELADVQRAVRTEGLERALGWLYGAGVYVTLDEFKGRRPIRRAGLEIAVKASDFDNPFLVAYYAGRTSGSRGAGSRILLDLDFLDHESAHLYCFLAANGAQDRPVAVWRGTPPGTDGLRAVLRYARIGRMPRRWFSPSRPGWSAEGAAAAVFLAHTLLVSRVVGRPIPAPRFVPRDQAVRVARWLAEMRARGTPALLISNASPVTRVCLAAAEHGLDIRGSVFIPGGEPYTPAKAAAVAGVGAHALPAYALQELGTIGFGCADPAALDDLHVLSDKVALIERERRFPATGANVQALVYTGMLASGPKMMLNVESGDYATVAQRECACALGAMGLTTHLMGVRSYEKLTSEGVTFMGSGLYHLLEEALPARFGGSPGDYQLVEEEEESLPRVSVVVAPRVGAVDEDAVVEAVLRELAAYPQGGALMASQWRQGRTLRVVRREPYVTSSSKILPLHVRHAVRTRPAL